MQRELALKLLETCQEKIELATPHLDGPRPDLDRMWEVLQHTHAMVALLSEVLYSLVAENTAPPGPEVPGDVN